MSHTVFLEVMMSCMFGGDSMEDYFMNEEWDSCTV